MKVLEVEPVEPLSLSSHPIGGAEIFTVLRSLPAPSPTTVAGALGASLGVSIKSRDPVESLEELCARLLELCGSSKPVVQGPLLRFTHSGAGLDDLYTVVHPGVAVSLAKNIISVDGVFPQLDLSRCGELSCIEFKPLTLVGVSLQRRRPGEDKVVRYGYTYRYQLNTYRTPSGRAVKPVYTYKFNCSTTLTTSVIRFGGEGRIAIVRVESGGGEPWLERIASPVDGLEKGLYIALSPVPLIPKRDDIILSRDSVELPIPLESIVGVPQHGRPPKIRVERFGLGFSEVAGRRRPVVLALPPGTILRIESPTRFAEGSGLMKILLLLGFASLYKIQQL